MTRYTLVLVAGPGAVPGVTRLRAALKVLWRGYALKCIEVRESQSGESNAETVRDTRLPGADASSEAEQSGEPHQPPIGVPDVRASTDDGGAADTGLGNSAGPRAGRAAAAGD